MKFSDLDLSPAILDGLRDLRFEEPTPIQSACIPVILEGRDVIATAQTGTGKTGAFAIPIMERVLRSQRGGVKCLILSPTRELATQIDEQVYAIGYHSGLTSATVIGGSDFASQAKAFRDGVDIIVATPGRLIDQKKVSNPDFSKIEFFVLDEADRMLDMGFLPDIKKIISWLPEARQNLLFSATMPEEIVRLTKSFMREPQMINIARSKPNQNVVQYAYELKSEQKIDVVKELLHQIRWESCIIFTSTKRGTDQLERLLKKEGIRAVSIHGDRSQDERNRALQDFVNGTVPVIVATDVLARGIDIKGVSMIINFDVPNNTDDYIHRIGRTGRYDKSGVAITFSTKRDARMMKEILDIKDNAIRRVTIPEQIKRGARFDLGLTQDLLAGDAKPIAAGDTSASTSGATKEPETASSTSGGASAPSQRSGGPRTGDTPTSASDSTGAGRSREQSDDRRGSRGGEYRREAGGDQRSSDRGDRRPDAQRGDARGGSHRGMQEDRGRVEQRGRSHGPAGHTNGRSQHSQHAPSNGPQREAAEASPLNVYIIDKATDRISYIRPPRKGILGILTSVIPRISSRKV